MKNSIFDSIKKDREDMVKIINRDYGEIKELENNPAVQRYLHLKSLEKSRDLLERGEKGIVGIVIEKYGHGLIKETNNIWCYLYELDSSKAKEISLQSGDDNIQMVVYIDIENSSRVIAISKEEKEEFEATHKVVYGNQRIGNPIDRYYNTRHYFFEYCLKDGQDKAVKKILTKRPDDY